MTNKHSPHDSSPITVALRSLYQEHGVAHREIRHGPTFTSAESAAARGEPLQIGGKALLLKCSIKSNGGFVHGLSGNEVELADRLLNEIRGHDGYLLVVLPATAQFDSNRARASFGVTKTRFATVDELMKLTGLVPGCVPPFGHPILPFPLVADSTIYDNDRIAFNAGSLTISHVLSMPDYIKLAQPFKFRIGRSSVD